MGDFGTLYRLVGLISFIVIYLAQFTYKGANTTGVIWRGEDWLPEGDD